MTWAGNVALTNVCALSNLRNSLPLALGDFAVSILLARFHDGPMGDTSELAAPPRVVVQVSPGRTHLRMD